MLIKRERKNVIINKFKMKKVIFAIAVMIVGCSSNPNAKLELENKSLKMKIDSLEHLITSSFSPIVINNNYQPNFGEADSINFVVGLMWNKSELIDSIDINLKNNKSGEMPLEKYFVRKKVSNGFTYITLSNLKIGKYIYKGNLYFRKKEFPLYYEFEIGG